jgi:hypothetical protein
LGNRAADTDQDGESRHGEVAQKHGEVAQNRILKLKHPSTHKFPELLPAVWPALTRWFDADQMGPHCGGDAVGIP